MFRKRGASQTILNSVGNRWSKKLRVNKVQTKLSGFDWADCPYLFGPGRHTTGLTARNCLGPGSTKIHKQR